MMTYNLLQLTPKKDVLFITGDWNTKVGSQEISGATGKFGLGVQNEAGQRLTEFCQENTLVIANNLFKQHKRRLHIWTSPHGQCWNQTDYILWSQRFSKSFCICKFYKSFSICKSSNGEISKNKTGTDCSSDHELLIAKFRLKLKKVGEMTRPFRYDLNQIPYDYTVKVTNRFKGLDLIECLKNYAWRFMTLYRRQ